MYCKVQGRYQKTSISSTSIHNHTIMQCIFHTMSIIAFIPTNKNGKTTGLYIIIIINEKTPNWYFICRRLILEVTCMSHYIILHFIIFVEEVEMIWFLQTWVLIKKSMMQANFLKIQKTIYHKDLLLYRDSYSGLCLAGIPYSR